MTGFYVVREHADQLTPGGAHFTGTRIGPKVVNVLRCTDTVIAGPFDDCIDAQADLLVRVGAYPDHDTAIANAHRWGGRSTNPAQAERTNQIFEKWSKHA